MLFNFISCVRCKHLDLDLCIKQRATQQSIAKPQNNMANRGKGYGPPLSNISEAVGNTPLVKISDKLCPEGRTVYAKCEYFNPLSSVKDRLALAIIEQAEKDGSL